MVGSRGAARSRGGGKGRGGSRINRKGTIGKKVGAGDGTASSRVRPPPTAIEGLGGLLTHPLPPPCNGPPLTSLGDADGGGEGADGVVEHGAEVVLGGEPVHPEVLAGVVQQPPQLPHRVLPVATGGGVGDGGVALGGGAGRCAFPPFQRNTWMPKDLDLNKDLPKNGLASELFDT